jgi:hypothetical protein
MQIPTTKDLDAQPNFTKKLDIMRLLGHLCQELDLTESQVESAKSSYEAVGRWLSESELPELRSAIIYAQGSTALGTANRPVRGNEFDVDLVHHLPSVTTNSDPASVKRLIGARLSEHEHYRSILEEKQRCWRLNYAGQYHLDITPSINNPSCSNGGELVPDRKLRQWKATNPKGYLQWFEAHAATEPRFVKTFAEALARAEVRPFPEPEEKKGLLRRTIQICKRHRDIYFSTRAHDLTPVSIVITTLVAKSYAHCVSSRIYNSELDLLIDIVGTMPLFIRIEDHGGKLHYLIPNEATEGENFADKWNLDSRLPAAFFEWHRKLTEILGGIENQRGLDIIGNTLSAGFGEAVVKPAVARFAGNVSAARSSDQLSVVPGVGLAASAAGVRVQRNTFFGQ